MIMKTKSKTIVMFFLDTSGGDDKLQFNKQHTNCCLISFLAFLLRYDFANYHLFIIFVRLSCASLMLEMNSVCRNVWQVGLIYFVYRFPAQTLKSNEKCNSSNLLDSRNMNEIVAVLVHSVEHTYTLWAENRGTNASLLD